MLLNINEDDIQNNIKNTIREIMLSEFSNKFEAKLDRFEFED